jgi:hypothetical protein
MGKKTSQYLGIIAALIVTNLVADLTGAVENAEIIEYIGCYDGENIQREKTLSFTRIEPSGLEPCIRFCNPVDNVRDQMKSLLPGLCIFVVV